jgi:hypothetical protein
MKKIQVEIIMCSIKPDGKKGNISYFKIQHKAFKFYYSHI